jgi:large-conductance mechanosensitive channel
MMVRAINHMRRMHAKEEKAGTAPPVEPPEDVKLLREIRDELRLLRPLT